MRGRYVVALAVVAVVVLVALTWQVSGRGMMGWNGPGFSEWGIVMFFVGALMTCGVLFVGASLLRPSRVAATIPAAASARPLDILEERFARGELTREEYDQTRKELER